MGESATGCSALSCVGERCSQHPADESEGEQIDQRPAADQQGESGDDHRVLPAKSEQGVECPYWHLLVEGQVVHYLYPFAKGSFKLLDVLSYVYVR